MKSRRNIVAAALLLVAVALVEAHGQRSLPPTVQPLVTSPHARLSQDYPLLQVATKVANSKRLYQPWLSGLDYVWLSNHEVLIYRASKRGFLWLRCNLKTGKSLPLVQLSQHFNRAGSFPTWTIHSPDSNWLLWQGTDDKPTGDGIHEPIYASHEYAATLDGKRLAGWSPEPGYNLWATDNRHWINMPRDSYGFPTKVPFQAVLYDVQSPNFKRVIPLVKESALRFKLVMGGPEDPSGPDPVIWRSDSEVIVRVWGQTDSQEVELRDVNLFDCRRPMQRHTIRLPMSSYIKSAQYSPKADRIAWLLCADKRRGPVKVGIYLCEADGSRFKEIGSIQVKNGPYNLMEPNDLRWLPDGRHLSFVYKEGLYTVPVE